MRKEVKIILICSLILMILLLAEGKNIKYAQLIFGTLLIVFIIFQFIRLSNFFSRDANGKWNKKLRYRANQNATTNDIFSYFQSKFSFLYFGERKEYDWTDIKTLVAYKEDLMTYDEIYLKILFTNNQSFLITENTLGWAKFIELLEENIPSIKKDWKLKILQPPFEMNLTLLYDKENRSEKIAINECLKA